jgi:CheY-like chemotaxis protein
MAPILLVEDNPDEVLLLRRALKMSGCAAAVAVVHDGVEAVEYLSSTGAFRDRTMCPLPWLIVLDLRLPRLSGLGVLKWLREQPSLRRLPVVVLSSSAEERDIAGAYDLGANSYLVKPSSIAGLRNLVGLIDQYWMGANSRPPLDPNTHAAG